MKQLPSPRSSRRRRSRRARRLTGKKRGLSPAVRFVSFLTTFNIIVVLLVIVSMSTHLQMTESQRISLWALFGLGPVFFEVVFLVASLPGISSRWGRWKILSIRARRQKQREKRHGAVLLPGEAKSQSEVLQEAATTAHFSHWWHITRLLVDWRFRWILIILNNVFWIIIAFS